MTTPNKNMIVVFLVSRSPDRRGNCTHAAGLENRFWTSTPPQPKE